MDFDKLLKTRLFLLVIFILPLSGVLGGLVSRLFKLNKTLGWRFDIMNSPIDYITGYLPILYIIVYLIMSILKIHTDLFFSKIHLLAICISSALFSFTDINFKIILIAVGTSFVMFIANTFASLKNRNSELT